MSPKETLLYRITELMFEKQQTFLLLDELYEDEVISPFVRNIQIDSPYQQLLFDGVLSQYNHQNEIVVSFTIEAYFHHLLAKVLEKNSLLSTSESLFKLIKENNLKGLPEAISNLLSLDVEKKDFSRITDFTDLNELGNETLDLCLMPIIYSLQISGVDNTLKNLLINNTDNDWALIQKCHKKLLHFEMHFLRNELTQFLINLKNETNQKYYEIISSGISELEGEVMLDVLSKLENLTIQKNSNIFFNIAYCYEKLQINDLALKNYKQSLELENSSDKPKIAMLYQKLAWTYYNLGDLDLALKFNEDSLEIRINLFGGMNQFVAHTLNDLGLVWDARGDVKKGIEFIKKSIDILEKVLGENIIDIGTSYYNLGNLFYSEKDELTALAHFNKCIKIYNKLLGENHVNLQYFYFSIGILEFNMRKYTKALNYFEKSLNITNKFLGKFHEESNSTYQWIGCCQYELGFYKEAIMSFLNSNKIKISSYNYNFLGLCNKKLNSLEEAISHFKLALELDYKKDIIENIVQCYEAFNQSSKALELLLQSLQIRKDDPESKDELINYLIQKIKALAKQLNKENELPQWIKNIN